MRLKKVKLSVVINVILIIMLILNCQSVYQNTTEKNYHIYEITLFMIVLSTGYYWYTIGCKTKKIVAFLLLSFVYYLYILVYDLMAVNASNQLAFWGRYIAFPIIYLFFSTNAKDIIGRFQKQYINVVCVITCISLFFWFFGSVFHLITPTSSVAVDWGWTKSVNSYLGLYFECQKVDWLGFDLYRNQSIFIEGPMYSLVLTIALLFLYNTMETQRNIKLKVFILFSGLISSFSITGFIFIVIVSFAYILRKSKNPVIVAAFVLPVIMLSAFVIFRLKSSTGSFALRMDDFSAGIKAWRNAPIFGNGFQNDDAIRQYYKYNFSEHGYSNSLFALLAEGGIYFTALYVFPIMFNIRKSIKNKGVTGAVFAVGYLICMLGVVFQTFFINFFIWCILLKHNEKKEVYASE